MGSPGLTSTALLTVAVADADDRDPLFDADLYRVQLQEDAGLGDVGLGVGRGGVLVLVCYYEIY